MPDTLTTAFFNRPTLEVAKALLGKTMVFGKHQGIITETEAYIGKDDPACHAAAGKTKRTEIMFGKPGYSYVYLIYGMYHCLNFVTEEEGFPAAVLIRGLWLSTKHLDGPGKLCRELAITKEHNGLDICNSDYFYVKDGSMQPKYDSTPRIGITKGTDKLWRFVVKNAKQKFANIHVDSER